MARARQSRIRDTELSALIDLVYRAALEPEEWPAFLGAMTKVTGSELTCLLLLDATEATGQALWQWGVPEDAQRDYLEANTATGEIRTAIERYRRDSAIFREWSRIHRDSRWIKDGKRYALALDTFSGGTTLAPWLGPDVLPPL